MSEIRKVLIIGGGNCGLTLATGLKKIGVPHTVFERENKDDFVNKPRDWGMLLHWGTEYLENVLPAHLKERMKEARVDQWSGEMTEDIPYFDAISGELVRRIGTPGVINRVSRRKLRSLLFNGENLDVQFSKKLKNVRVEDDLVHVEFEDGTEDTGNLLVGADGSHSKVREFLVGTDAAKLEDKGLTMINFPYGGFTPEEAHFLRSFHPIVQLCFHGDLGSGLLAALDIPDPVETKDWKFQVYCGWWGPPFADDLGDPKVRMKFFKEHMSKFCEPFRTAAMAVSDDHVIPVFPGQQWAPTMKWDNYGGKVTLAGDAAHSMLPHRGQGLNNALKDASDIFDVVRMILNGDKNLQNGITAYEEEMRSRGAKEVALSYERAELGRNVEMYRTSPLWDLGHISASKINRDDLTG